MATTSTDPLTASPMPGPPNFPVTWEHPDDARLFWTIDRMHLPDPITPLEFWYWQVVYEQGSESAAPVYELPHMVVRRINTYLYYTVVPPRLPAGETEAYGRRSEAKLRAMMARLGEAWRAEFLP